MKDPRRLGVRDGEGSDFERRLIRSAKGERPPADVERRMARALGLPGASSALGATKAGAIAWASAGVLAVGFAGGMIGARLFSRVTPQPTAQVRAQAATPTPTFAPAPALEPAAPIAPPRARPPKIEHPAGDLRAEIELLGRARDALAAGAPSSAL